MYRIGLERCPYCGGSDVYASRPKSLWQELPILFLLRLARCHHCMHRHYRPLFVPTPQHPPKTSKSLRQVNMDNPVEHRSA